MKRILVGLLIVAGMYFGANMYFGYKIEKELKSMASNVQMVGGHLTYTDVKINYKGNIQVDNLSFFAPGMDENLRIDQLLIQSGSFLGVHKLANDMQESRIPEQVNWLFKGVQVPVGGEMFKQMVSFSENDDAFNLAACGDKKSLKFDDYLKMGYPNTVSMDIFVDFTVFNEGQWFVLDVRAQTEEMSDSRVKLDVTLNATSRDAMVIGASAMNAELNEIVMEYEDKGFVSRLLNFCRDESGLPRNDYIESHIAEWGDAWREQGYIAGENIVDAYSTFVNNPQSFSLTATPNNVMNIQKMMMTSPDLILYELKTQLVVNGQPKGALDITAMDKAQQEEWVAQQEAEESNLSEADSETPQKETRRWRKGKPKSVPISVEELSNHTMEMVELRLSSGRRVEGRILKADDKKLIVHSYQPGGSMEVPVKYSQITDAALKK